MRKRELLLRAIRMLQHERQVLARRERLEANDIDLVVRPHLVVVRGVHERQREHALLLEIRLVDTRERARDDREAAEEARLERGVLAGGPLAVVVVADDDPLDAVVAVVGSGGGDSTEFTGDLVLDLVGLAVLLVDGTNQAVLCESHQYLQNHTWSAGLTGDVLKVSTVLEPGAASRNVISCYKRV